MTSGLEFPWEGMDLLALPQALPRRLKYPEREQSEYSHLHPRQLRCLTDQYLARILHPTHHKFCLSQAPKLKHLRRQAFFTFL